LENFEEVVYVLEKVQEELDQLKNKVNAMNIRLEEMGNNVFDLQNKKR
jgi:predicted  nucleic acid-binding Zn-ribbon protein